MIWRFEQGPWDGRYLGVADRYPVPMVIDVGEAGEVCTYEFHRKIGPAEFIFRYPGLRDP